MGLDELYLLTIWYLYCIFILYMAISTQLILQTAENKVQEFIANIISKKSALIRVAACKAESREALRDACYDSLMIV